MLQRVRRATPAEVPAITAIHGHAVRDGVATFDVADPPPPYWQAKPSSAEPGDHVVVVEDASTAVVGYAYSKGFRPRPAYARTRETSIYLAPEAVGHWLGRLTYSHLLSFNLIRAANVLTGTDLARATTATLRRKLIHVPARANSPGRRLILHLPTG